MQQPRTEETSLRAPLHPLNDEADLDRLIEEIGDARVVMLGEASHGTHEYYTWRARISKRLIRERGFQFIAVEGDWPACYGLNRFVKHYAGSPEEVTEVLREFGRWPTWMWANWEIAGLGNWLRSFNADRSPEARVGFYGLDVYSLWESMNDIMTYLEREDPEAAELAKQTITCFEPYKNDEKQYAWATRMVPESCEQEVVDLLRAILDRSQRYQTDVEDTFSTEQNARVAVNAERYYRSMVRSGPQSWNVRDRHMMQTLDRLLDFHEANSKAIVWEHNTHIGDARYTDMAHAGMVNIGQLAREAYGEAAVRLVGFGSYAGTVVAGQAWGAPPEVMDVPPARENSWEAALHRAGSDRFYLLSSEFEGPAAHDTEVDHRAIGVVYDPAREAYGNYVPSRIGRRYDAFIHIDRTRALHPLDVTANTHRVPETYPWNL
ncbi:erythromycin esterase family protein [Neolewinella sp.]|uniref:erythromycin esterase family protein n=1 Tax=Neolewinella sp. TaxID=2993543 RepID=UPI003B52AD59